MTHISSQWFINEKYSNHWYHGDSIYETIGFKGIYLICEGSEVYNF